MARIVRSISAYLRELLSRLLSRSSAETVAGEAKLTGAPLRLRLKSYSSESGRVYQYVYRGRRVESVATTFVFSVTANRKDWSPISVVLNRRTVEDWQSADGRTLRDADLYAIAKMSLFDSFDRSMESPPLSPIRPGADDISRRLDALGLL